MTTLQKVWTRPALMIFTESQPIAVNAAIGQYDLGSAAATPPNFLYLTDDSRSELQISIDRIEFKKRMINGRMRSYHVADKKSFSVNWKDLPSVKTEISESQFQANPSGWASCQEMLLWHKNHSDSFYLTLVYDTPLAAAEIPLKYSLETYNVFFEDFSYVVKKRGPLHDLWDISMTLVEV
jgi:hypothetical protein